MLSRRSSPAPGGSRLTRRAAAAALLALLVVSAPACALYGFDEDGGFDLPIAATQTFTVPIDLEELGGGSGATAPRDHDFVVPLPPNQIDLLSTSDDLAKNKDKLERLEITQIKVRPLANSLTTALPPIQLAVGSFQSDGSDAVLVATIPSIPAGSTTQVDAAVDEAGTDGAQPYLTSLQFSFVPSAVLNIQKGQLIPSGSARLEIEITVQATVDPTK